MPTVLLARVRSLHPDRALVTGALVYTLSWTKTTHRETRPRPVCSITFYGPAGTLPLAGAWDGRRVTGWSLTRTTVPRRRPANATVENDGTIHFR